MYNSLLQDDSEDWASMRSWVVWCLRANLDDDDSDAICEQTTHNNRRSFLSRQAALDTSSSRDRHCLHRANNSYSLGSDGAGKESAQNSFDSTNCYET